MAASNSKAWSKSLHDARGCGSGSRSQFNRVKLEEAGWQILSRQSGNRVHFTYIDPDGKKYKSSKDVERKLNADGALFQFLEPEIENVEEAAVTIAQTVKAVHEESDEDYEPPTKQRADQAVVKSG